MDLSIRGEPYRPPGRSPVKNRYFIRRTSIAGVSSLTFTRAADVDLGSVEVSGRNCRAGIPTRYRSPVLAIVGPWVLIFRSDPLILLSCIRRRFEPIDSEEVLQLGARVVVCPQSGFFKAACRKVFRVCLARPYLLQSLNQGRKTIQALSLYKKKTRILYRL